MSDVPECDKIGPVLQASDENFKTLVELSPRPHRHLYICGPPHCAVQ